MKTAKMMATGAALLLVSLPAVAHPGFPGHDLASGLAHPFTGLDHLLLLALLGVLVARRGWHLAVPGLIAAVGVALWENGVPSGDFVAGLALGSLAVTIATAAGCRCVRTLVRVAWRVRSDPARRPR